jgi:hypothetical protein
MAEVKGVLLRGSLSYVKEVCGSEAFEAAVESLSPEDRDLLPAVLLDSNWYPFDVWRVIRRIARVTVPHAGTGFALEMGKHMAELAFTGVYKSLVVNDPVKQVEKLPWINDLFYRDTRKVDIIDLTPSSCTVRYKYESTALPRRSTCISSMGLTMRLIELAGGRNVKGTHTNCVIDGNSHCEFPLEWS